MAQNDHESGVTPEEREVQPTQESQTPNQPTTRLSVVGVGASAGGLAALRTFFSVLPSDTGMTFVVVTHLSPQHESILAELLQPYTEMPVRQVTEPVTMQPNHVYVIPPGKRLLVMEDHLDLAEFELARGQRLQIDTFFRSLAEHHGDGGAVILSGTGSDGAVGIQNIKEKGGLILVQEPTEAEYDGMPKSAIATGLVDIVAPVAELATQLVAAKRTGATLELPASPAELSSAAEETLVQILTHLRVRSGHDFSGYKQATILRRIGRRMQVTQLASLTSYLHRLRHDGEEADALYRDLLIHVTEFFRDPEAWNVLAESIIPQLFSDKRADENVRVWVVGCATGEEAYGVAMLLSEYAGTLARSPQIQVFASDLGELALTSARRGIYPEAIATNVSAERLGRFFIEENSHYRVRDELRERVLFTPHNLLQDPPFSKLDLVLCRNLLIYLQRPLQERVFEIFHYALRPEGYLFLGSAESPDSITTLFETFDKQHRIYRRSRQSQGTLVLPMLALQPKHLTNAGQGALASGERVGDDSGMTQWLMEAVAPPSLLVDANYHVLQLSETAGRFLQHPAGALTPDVLKLVRLELQTDLRAALFRALETEKATLTRPVPVRFNGAPHPVALLVRPLRKNGERHQALVFFLEDETPLSSEGNASAQAIRSASLQQVQNELGQAQRQLQSMREEYETTVEELRSANEELQSTNEEYRSTLEELETSKEELQSINEELQTVNLELRSKVEETAQANSDLHNLFSATEIATLFLDREMRIKRYTPRAADLFNLMPTDQGRPIGHLRTTLHYEQLEGDARQVLKHLAAIEREVQDDDDHWYQVNVRPYRTPNDHIDGVVITFVDITANKRNELALQEAKAYAESIVHTIPDALLVLDTDLRVRTANDSFYAMFQVDPANTEGQQVYDLGNGQWNIPELRTLLEEILPDNSVFTNYEVSHTFDAIGRRTMLLNGRRLDHIQLILLAITDISERKQAEEALHENEQRFRALVNATSYIVYRMGPDWSEMRELNGQGFLKDTKRPTTTWLDEYIAPADQPAVQAAIQKAIQTKSTFELEHRVRRLDGSLGWTLSRAVPLLDEQGEIVEWFGAASDVTARKQAEIALREFNMQLEEQVQERTGQVRELVTQLALSEQEERQHLSQVLHDDLQQRLYAVQFQLSILRDTVGGKLEDAVEAEALNTFTQIETQLQDSIQLTRSLSVDLSPPVLEGEGLEVALGWLATQMTQRYGMSIRTQITDGLPPLSTKLRVLLFQVVRELLFNVVKHAGVSETLVTLNHADHKLHIEVVDQGAGFDTTALVSDPTQSHGLLQNQRRLELIGGKMQIESSPEHGTRVRLTCPLPEGSH